MINVFFLPLFLLLMNVTWANLFGHKLQALVLCLDPIFSICLCRCIMTEAYTFFLDCQYVAMAYCFTKSWHSYFGWQSLVKTHNFRFTFPTEVLGLEQGWTSKPSLQTIGNDPACSYVMYDEWWELIQTCQLRTGWRRLQMGLSNW